MNSNTEKKSIAVCKYRGAELFFSTRTKNTFQYTYMQNIDLVIEIIEPSSSSKKKKKKKKHRDEKEQCDKTSKRSRDSSDRYAP